MTTQSEYGEPGAGQYGAEAAAGDATAEAEAIGAGAAEAAGGNQLSLTAGGDFTMQDSITAGGDVGIDNSSHRTSVDARRIRRGLRSPWFAAGLFLAALLLGTTIMAVSNSGNQSDSAAGDGSGSDVSAYSPPDAASAETSTDSLSSGSDPSSSSQADLSGPGGESLAGTFDTTDQGGDQLSGSVYVGSVEKASDVSAVNDALQDCDFTQLSGYTARALVIPFSLLVRLNSSMDGSLTITSTLSGSNYFTKLVVNSSDGPTCDSLGLTWQLSGYQTAEEDGWAVVLDASSPNAPMGDPARISALRLNFGLNAPDGSIITPPFSGPMICQGSFFGDTGGVQLVTPTGANPDCVPVTDSSSDSAPPTDTSGT